jgi:NTE family protein
MRKTVGNLFVLTALSMFAQPAPRPKVALVLGGGGALGLAHVGVIQWLEEQHIPVDIVAGTSMGGLVAALYATGNNASEIRDFVARIDWDDALRIDPSYSQLIFRRREDVSQFPNRLRVGVNKGLHLPAGLSPGHGVGIVLSRFTSAYGDIEDFDQLPIPFACVATDLVRGEKVVFRSGRLFDALRSTMAIPGLFTPWKLGDQVLVDGGTLDNLPVGVARDMGADVVIAVVLETPPIDGKAVQSLFGVAGRSISVMIANNEKASMARADILVAPMMNSFKGSDYKRGEDLRQAGYLAAQKVRGLNQLALPTAEWQAHLAARRARRRPEPAAGILQVAGVAGPGKALLERDLNRDLGSEFTQRALEREVGGIPGRGNFDSADYRVIRQGTREVIEVTARPSPLGRFTLDVLPQFDAASGESSRFGLGGRFKALGLGTPASELRMDLIGGAGNNALSTEYYWRPGRSRLFVAPAVGVTDQRIPFRKSDRLLAELGSQLRYFDAVAGWALRRTSELRFGMRLAQTKTRLTSGTLPFSGVEGNFASLRAQYRYFGQDSALVPRRGWRITGEADWIVNTANNVTRYGVWDGSAAWAKPLGGPYSILTSLAGGAAPDRAGAQTLFTLGGTGRLNALARNQLFGHRYYLAQAGVLREIGVSSFAKIYGAALFESGAVYLRGFDGPSYRNASVGVIGETFLGILYVGGGFGDKGEKRFFFRVGRLF